MPTSSRSSSSSLSFKSRERNDEGSNTSGTTGDSSDRRCFRPLSDRKDDSFEAGPVGFQHGSTDQQHNFDSYDQDAGVESDEGHAQHHRPSNSSGEQGYHVIKKGGVGDYRQNSGLADGSEGRDSGSFHDDDDEMYEVLEAERRHAAARHDDTIRRGFGRHMRHSSFTSEATTAVMGNRTSETTGRASPSGSGAASTGMSTYVPSFLRVATDSGSEQSLGKSAPSFLRWIEIPFQVKVPGTDEQHSINDEATGWAMDTVARGPLNMSGSFLGTAVLHLAAIDAGCTNASTCEKEVLGLRPSSLLTVSSVVVGLMTAFTMPIVGAVIDHTRHRKTIGVVTAVALALISAVQIMISQKTWKASLLLEIIGGYVLNVHTTTILAYLPDLTHEHDVAGKGLAVYTARFNICRSIMMLMYLVVVSGLAMVATLDSVGTARLGQALAFFICSVFFAYAWRFLLRKRSALSSIPEGQNMATVGFYQVAQTSKKVWKTYPAWKWFMLSLLVSPEAGSGVYLTITVTYLTVLLKLSSSEIGFVIFACVACAIPGSMISKWASRKHNALRTFQSALLLCSIMFSLQGAVLTGPERKYVAFLFGGLYGLLLGWIAPAQRILYCTLTPRGQDAEVMGFFQFCGHILGWLPPLVFSAMNESGVDMRASMSFTAIYPLVASLFLLPIGSYTDATRNVSQQLGVQSIIVSRPENSRNDLDRSIVGRIPGLPDEPAAGELDRSLVGYVSGSLGGSESWEGGSSGKKSEFGADSSIAT